MKLRMSLAAIWFLSFASVPTFATDLRVLASWDDSHPARRILLATFLKNVETASKGDLSFKLSGPETVPAFEQLQPVSAGVFQMLFTHSGYHTGSTTFLIPIDGLKGDSKTARESGLYDLIDKHYQRFGLKLIFMTKSIEGSGYQIILRQPTGQSGDLAGRKIRGTQSYGGVFSLLHASPVVMPPGEVYSALEKGIIDGAAWPAIGVLDYKWNEVAKFLMRPLFGSSPYYLFVNLSSWNSLSTAQQSVLIEEGKKIQEFWDPEWLRLSKVEQDKLIAAGSRIAEVDPKLGAQLNTAWASGLWTLAATKAGPKDLGELRAFAKTHGME